MKPSRIPFVTLVIVLTFFYLPIGFLLLNSFNDSRFASKWNGFSFRWYERLIERQDILAALGNSLKIATVASIVSMILGTAAAFALQRNRSRLQGAHRMLIAMPLVLPDILMGMSLLLLFITLGMKLSMFTISIAHITFCLSYVALVVQARLQNFDTSLIEAARDLGASKFQAFVKVTLPLIAPGILAGGLLAFTLSIDDYVITFFVSGPGTTTLPLRVASMMRTSRSLPVINALSTLLIASTFLLAALSFRLQRRP